VISAILALRVLVQIFRPAARNTLLTEVVMPAIVLLGPSGATRVRQGHRPLGSRVDAVVKFQRRQQRWAHDVIGSEKYALHLLRPES